MRPIVQLGVIAGLLIYGTAIGSPASAQAVLSDYERQIPTIDPARSAEWRLAFRPAGQVLQQTVASLKKLPNLSAAQLAEADALLARASTQDNAEAIKLNWSALNILLGRKLTESELFISSLKLAGSSPILSGTGDDVFFTPQFPVSAPPGLGYTIDLVDSVATTSATPIRGDVVKPLARGAFDGGIASHIKVDLSDVPDGRYLIIAKITGSEQEARELAWPAYIIRDLDTRYATLKKQLASVNGHDEAKSIIEYPFALAKAIQAGTREVISYDFAAEIRRSYAILVELKAGGDPVYRATGLQNRAYRFAETGELVPFQLYVPKTWSPSKKWPVVVALHGANLDETNMLGRAKGRMQELAEKYGYIVVAPLGYRLNSAYGSERGMIAALGKRDDPRFRRSEADVLQVLKLVESEYSIDTSRRYITGNSMGGAGTWWFGIKYPQLWAAIAPAAYGSILAEDTAALKGSALMLVVGDKDELGFLDRVRESGAILKAAGVPFDYVEVPGGTHASGFDIAMPEIFSFFAKHRRQDAADGKMK